MAMMGIPPDLVRHSDVYALSAIPRLWHTEFMRIKEVHKLGITGKYVSIGISDTGIATHDLLPRVKASRDFTRSPNGVKDMNGHGTHCAGIALGRFADGVSLGIAPDADLFVAKVLGDNGSGSTAGINAGRIWLAKEGVDVISESLGDNGGPPITEDIRSYEEAYGIGVNVCVAALGNAGFSGSGNTAGRPGSYVTTMGIAALKEDGLIAGFSSGGPSADFATPGQNIISCGLRNNLVSMSGTSMACPLFAGLAALIIHKRRMNGMAELRGYKEWREFLSQPAFLIDPGAPGHDPRYGFGIPVISKIIDYLLDTEWV